MNTPKEPSAVERAIEAQRRAKHNGSSRDLLTAEQLAALFAIQALYDQLEKKHGEALAEIETLKASRAAAVDQEQLSRNECNRLRAELAKPTRREKLIAEDEANEK